MKHDNTRWFGLVAAGLALALSACGASEELSTKEGALTLGQNRVLGFEAPTQDWSTTNGSPITSTTTKSQGSAALSVQPNGYTEVVSTTISAPGGARATATFDLRLPQTLGWGDARLVAQIPSAGQYWRDLGGTSLGGLTPGVFHTFSFPMPSDLRAALNGNAQDVRFRIILNVPWGSGSYLLDNLVVADGTTTTPGAAATEPVAFSITIPEGTAIADVMLSATNAVTIDDRSTLGESGKLSHLGSLGPARLEFGAQVNAHTNVSSIGGVDFLRSQSHVYGSVRTSGTVTQQDNVSVDGGITTGVPIAPVSTTWTVDWPTGVTRDISRAPDSPATRLVPGAWDSIQIFSRAGIQFESGVYFVNSLVVEPQAKIYIDASAGPVILYVRDTLRLNVGLTYVGGTAGQVLFGYAGNQQAYFEEAVVASVVAPNSVIELRRPASGRAHAGSFFGKDVHVNSDATVRHLPLDWTFVCPSGDFDGDSVLDCFDPCWADPNKTEPGVCDCGRAETDTDSDNVPDCLDECPLDAGKQSRGICGCPSDADVKPAGAFCNDGYVRGEFTCDGQGTCGDPTAVTIRPDPSCTLRTTGNRGYWVCTGAVDDDGPTGGSGSGDGGGGTATGLCAKSPGGRLVQIDTREENALVAKLVVDKLGGDAAWIGAVDASTEGAWWWRGKDGAEKTQFWRGGSNGRRVDGRYTAWNGGAPPTDAARNCATIDANGNWHAEACTSLRRYVCEFSFGSDVDVTSGIKIPQPKGPGDIIPGWHDVNPTFPPGGSIPTPPPDCVEPTANGETIEQYRSAGSAAADRCNEFCGPESELSEEECDEYCSGPLAPPPSNATCTQPGKLSEVDTMFSGTCEVLDFSQLTGSDEERLAQLQAAQDCSDQHFSADGSQLPESLRSLPQAIGVGGYPWLPNLPLRCGVQTLCLALDASGAAQACSQDSDCTTGRCECPSASCEPGTLKYCIDEDLANACQSEERAPGGAAAAPTADRKDASGTCAGQCFSRIGCGASSAEILHAFTRYQTFGMAPRDPPTRCNEMPLLCGPEYEDTVTSGELETPKPFGDDSLPKEPDEVQPYPSDFEDPCANQRCTGLVCIPGPDEEETGACARASRHPWCNNYAVTTGIPSNAESDTRTSGRRGAGDSPVGFTIEPTSDLYFEVEPLPYGAAKFETKAAAGVRAAVDFDLFGTQGSVEVVDLRAEISASLCHASTAESRMEVVGVDFLPQIASAAIFDSDEKMPLVEGKKHSEVCEEAVRKYVDAFDRAKKALRDAQELITQYNELKAQGRTFNAGFCNAVAGPGMRPLGMGGACPEAPEAVINRFIDYYQYQATTGLQQAVEHLKSAALSDVALAAHLFGARGEKTYTLFAELGPNGGVGGEESVTLIALQFFIGPIPCVLEVSSYVDYGIQGGFGLTLDPAALIGGARDFVRIGAEVGPYANSGVTLFVGAGFNIGILELAVGVEGGVTLGHISLPAVVSAGLTLQRESEKRSERALPEDIADLTTSTVLFPQPGNLGQYAYQFRYKYGVGLEVTDILSGFLNGKLKVSFLFFSAQFSQRLATFKSNLGIEPVMLISGEGGAELDPEIGGSGDYDGTVADGRTMWKRSFESIPLLALEKLPVPSTALAANGTFNTTKVEKLYYDELCEDCSPSGTACERDADCCQAGESCVAGVCGPPTCLPTGTACTTDSDCCGGEGCYVQPNGSLACSARVCDLEHGDACQPGGRAAKCCEGDLRCWLWDDNDIGECGSPIIIR